MEIEKLEPIVESLLFASGEPIKISRLAKVSGAEKAEIENALMVISGEYSSQGRGFVILRKGDEVQIATNPDFSSYVSQLIEGELQEALSTAALEVLSVIAYRGPIARSEIELIRGVNCSYTLRNLLLRGLIERSDNPRDARGYVYVISFEFLKRLGIANVQELPDYEKLTGDIRIDSIISSQSQ